MRRLASPVTLVISKVSIHAPREGCDYTEGSIYGETKRVSIHAPREGCDLAMKGEAKIYELFQFTHPGRGATRIKRKKLNDYRVSIHAPREGCDVVIGGVIYEVDRFNSRTPGGVRLVPCLVRELNPGVSIHAPREGCDVILVNAVKRPFVFQFTHPGRGATQVLWNNHPYGECFNSRTPGGVRLSIA